MSAGEQYLRNNDWEETKVWTQRVNGLIVEFREIDSSSYTWSVIIPDADGTGLFDELAGERDES